MTNAKGGKPKYLATDDLKLIHVSDVHLTQRGGKIDNPLWDHAAKTLLRSATTLCVVTGGEIVRQSLDELLRIFRQVLESSGASARQVDRAAG